MQEPSLIALAGVKGAGKDTTHRFIQEWCAKSEPALSAVKRGFADKAKWAYMRQWVPGCTMKWAINFIDQWKNNETAIVTGLIKIEGVDAEFIEPVNFRDHLAQFATEGARDIYGYDHWVDMLLPKEPTYNNPEGWRGHFIVPPRSAEEDPYSFAHFAVINDMRFENELQRVKELGGLNVKIKRRDAEQKAIDEYKRQGREVHASELGLPDEMFDVIISNNDNDMDRAYGRTVHLMEEIQRNGIKSIKRGVPIPWRIGL